MMALDSTPAIQYMVWPDGLHGHRFTVSLTIHRPEPQGQVLHMPAWIPGSYLIRDFSKHIESITAFSLPKKQAEAKKKIALERLDNDRWFIPKGTGACEIVTTVYAFDQSVRTAYLDQERGFFNPTSLCLAVEGQAHLSCSLAIAPPHDQTNKQWQVQTTLRQVKTDASGFGFYMAKDYVDLIDHPVALGQFETIEWQSFGTPHRMVIQGLTSEQSQLLDRKQLALDLQRICDATIRLFEPRKPKAPFKQYLFIVNAALDGYGGLEHCDSTALLCKRDQLPYGDHSAQRPKKSYEEFLGLCSHEYFHAWLVKRIQAKAFQPYRLNERNYTRLLWLFEGFTSYYDDLQLMRSGCIGVERYLDLLSNTWNGVLRNPGRTKQSVADSSFDTWTKYYQMDENTPNAVVSYYAKGSLIALGLDLQIRQYSNNRQSLDDVMRFLWKEHGKTGVGINQYALDLAISTTIGIGFSKIWQRFKRDYIDGTQDLPLQIWLPQIANIEVAQKQANFTESIKLALGMRYTDSSGWIKITHVLDGGIAHQAGLAPNDLIGSINQQRITNTRMDQVLGSLVNSKKITFHHFRQDKEHQVSVALKLDCPAQYELKQSKK
jgi:predicted metalloprotease with PDZ domain